jgi:hypothetical protein
MKPLLSFFIFLSFPSSSFAASLTLSEISSHTKPLHYLKVSVPQNFDCTSLSFGEAKRTSYYDTTFTLSTKPPSIPSPLGLKTLSVFLILRKV